MGVRLSLRSCSSTGGQWRVDNRLIGFCDLRAIRGAVECSHSDSVRAEKEELGTQTYEYTTRTPGCVNHEKRSNT